MAQMITLRKVRYDWRKTQEPEEDKLLSGAERNQKEEDQQLQSVQDQVREMEELYGPLVSIAPIVYGGSRDSYVWGYLCVFRK